VFDLFWKRLFSGILLLALIFFFFHKGGLLLLLLLTALSLMGLRELQQALKLKSPLEPIIAVLTLFFMAAIYLKGSFALAVWPVLTLLALLSFFVLRYPAYRTEEIALAYLGFVYVPVLFSHVYLLRMLPQGGLLIWLVLISSWGTDTAAYCTGMLFGRHKMTPVLSPKKTWEGAAGGVIGAMLMGALLAFVFRDSWSGSGSPVLTFMLLCGLASVFSMLGDLAASAVKRISGIKDYSQLIPGHGGILDRFDSMLFTAPAIYYAALFLERILS